MNLFAEESRPQQDSVLTENSKIVGMSRRKQTRPQHFECGEDGAHIVYKENNLVREISCPVSHTRTSLECSGIGRNMTQSEFVTGKKIEAVTSTNNSSENEISRDEMPGCNHSLTTAVNEEEKSEHVPNTKLKLERLSPKHNIYFDSIELEAHKETEKSDSEFFEKTSAVCDDDRSSPKDNCRSKNGNTADRDASKILQSDGQNVQENGLNGGFEVKEICDIRTQSLKEPSAHGHTTPPNDSDTKATKDDVKNAGNSSPRLHNDKQSNANALTCIVCEASLPDVITLQRHLLSEHTEKKTGSPEQLQNGKEKPPNNGRMNRKNYRKVSTVSPPQLSLLSGVQNMLAKTSSSGHLALHNKAAETTVTNVPERSNSTDIDDDGVKLHKKRDMGERNQEYFSEQANFENKYLKKMKRDSDDNQTREKRAVYPDRGIDARRISCPVVTPDSLMRANFNPKDLPKILENDRYCAECDINFSSTANFRAHKQFYCASRHMQKFREVYQLNFDAPGNNTEECQKQTEKLYSKTRKRNVGNRSSMTPRKRSHLIPLEASRVGSQFEGGQDKKDKVYGGTPIASASDDETNASQADDGQCSATPVSTKKYFCKECNIWFSKYDTYIAHKKYYCESRRKDRYSIKATVPRKQSTTRPKSGFCESPNDTSSVASPEQKMCNSPTSSPGVVSDGHRRQSSSIEPPQINLQAVCDAFVPPFPYFNQSDSSLLARLSLMQPLLVNQYISMLQQKMAIGMQDKLDIYGRGLHQDITGGKYLPSYEKYRKMSVDESRASTESSKLATVRPNRQSCVAMINVKQEPEDKSTEDASPENHIPRGKEGNSPLDLSNWEDQKHAETSCSYPSNSVSPVQRETAENSPKESLTEQDDDGCCDNKRDQSDTAPSPSEHSRRSTSASTKERLQHCKNCDAKFTSLSTFIAHKKYYCSATNPMLSCSEVKHVQPAH